MQPIIEVKNLSKKYSLGSYQPYETLRDTIVSLFNKQGLHSNKLKKQEFWALKDINFEVQKGEVIGIIGRNGAGKSTLLRILSRITLPTEGEAIMHGRVASLLEVGTGFSPELTGRENIFLNGAVLGMGRKEIQRKFQAIVNFAEIGKFIDTPVKYYSSGMYTRLAFAVAAHLEPEILIVDEVLSVGDLRFQKKSLGKIEDLTHAEGRTVLFVSHNMGAVNQLCRHTILLDGGKVVFYGATEEAIRLYSLQSFDKNQFKTVLQGDLATTLKLTQIFINNKEANNQVLLPNQSIEFKAKFKSKKKNSNLVINFSLYKDGQRLFTLSDTENPRDQPTGNFISEFQIPSYLLRPGYYSIALGGYRVGSGEWCWGTDLAGFTIAEVWDRKNIQTNLGIFNLPNYGQRKNE